MTADPLLAIRNVEKRFGGLTALAGVSLDVPEGEVFGLIGPNGSGKTTLLNIVTGFLRADRGEVAFAGRRIDRLAPHLVARRGLCRTFQSSMAPQKLTVLENMLLAARIQRGESLVQMILHPRLVRAEEAAGLARAREILAAVNLDAKGDDYAGGLSGGQKKLLSLAQALMAEPRLILLDEPVAGVNPVLVEEISRIIRRLCAEGRNFLVVEHNMRFIRDTCDHIAVLDAGGIIAEGAPAEVLGREEVLSAYLARRPGGEPAAG